MDSLIVLLVIAAIVGLAGAYIYKSKKKGVQCIGCPDAPHCSGKCAGCSGCASQNK